MPSTYPQPRRPWLDARSIPMYILWRWDRILNLTICLYCVTLPIVRIMHIKKKRPRFSCRIHIAASAWHKSYPRRWCWLNRFFLRDRHYNIICTCTVYKNISGTVFYLFIKRAKMWASQIFAIIRRCFYYYFFFFWII